MSTSVGPNGRLVVDGHTLVDAPALGSDAWWSTWDPRVPGARSEGYRALHATGWTYAAIARRTGLSASRVARLCRATGRPPVRGEPASVRIDLRLTPSTVAELDRQRGDRSRAQVIADLIEAAAR